MDLPPEPREIDLNFLVPNVFPDGQIFTFPNSNPNAPVTVSFLQMRPPKNGKPRGDVVASVSFFNMESLKMFIQDAQRRISEHEKREE